MQVIICFPPKPFCLMERSFIDSFQSWIKKKNKFLALNLVPSASREAPLLWYHERHDWKSISYLQISLFSTSDTKHNFYSCLKRKSTNLSSPNPKILCSCVGVNRTPWNRLFFFPQNSWSILKSISKVTLFRPAFLSHYLHERLVVSICSLDLQFLAWYYG